MAQSATLRVLLALIAGLALGLPLAGSESSFASGLLAVLGPVGTIVINAIRMTVIPLVVSSLIVGVTSAPDPRAVESLRAGAAASGATAAESAKSIPTFGECAA